MKTYLQIAVLLICASAGFLAAGCGKKSATGSNASTTQPNSSASATQPNSPAAANAPEIAASLFERINARAYSLIQQKQYQAATETLKQLDNYKLSPTQESTVDALKAQIPK